MSTEIEGYLDYPMVAIPGEKIELRDDRITCRWKAEIKPFLLAPYPVTMDLSNAIINNSSQGDLKPVVNI
ncbi:hypothetical protein BSK62_10810 [Paenibacillus odorifer]|uniref:hypothetical protein n=1 Tax=Paenibacillus TaxID=44249 RepID=UPI00096E6F42|nr:MULTISPECIES: hypothetical protein [unclassified Paenibacillus]MDH6427391.1 hypothetical protein [Paenibacillus sp. PastH-4]MDH6443421.1 hypothetical protein [Paenibacillus sp. PastF-4]MDH6525875.1 hypothetical protein [Paenibacillus sp. PastH-3]OMD66475.1 hypothetical protein BSK62_10810 [Paenibacillus odorifer]